MATVHEVKVDGGDLSEYQQLKQCMYVGYIQDPSISLFVQEDPGGSKKRCDRQKEDFCVQRS